MKRELDQLGRFMNLVVEHKHEIGFPGTLLIEPKPFEPTKHQYDYDVGNVHAFLQKYGLEDEIKVNIEVNHATLAGHDFAHEVALAVANGIFGSVDANAGDDRLGWDVDRFPVSVEQMSLGLLEILRGGGFDTGGFLFDAKLRRQSSARDDLFHAHVGGMDTLARSLLVAASMRDELDHRRDERYAGWHDRQDVLDGKVSLQELHDARLASPDEPVRVSGRQEALENLVARHVERAR
jgi:xylose isomerase